MAYVICEPCVGVKDGRCADVCPMSCIYPRPSPDFPDMLYIHPVECIDCGLCVAECPVDAIFHEDDVPGEWTRFVVLNREATALAA